MRRVGSRFPLFVQRIPADVRPKAVGIELAIPLGEAKKLEKALGPIVDRLLLTKGIRRADSESRALLLTAFWMALRDAFASRQRNVAGDYAPDPKAARFPEWQASADAPKEKPKRGASKNSLTGLVEDWWKEAKRAGRKQSTYESYRNSMARLVTFLKHDTASQVRRAF